MEMGIIISNPQAENRDSFNNYTEFDSDSLLILETIINDFFSSLDSFRAVESPEIIDLFSGTGGAVLPFLSAGYPSVKITCVDRNTHTMSDPRLERQQVTWDLKKVLEYADALIDPQMLDSYPIYIRDILKAFLGNVGKYDILTCFQAPIELNNKIKLSEVFLKEGGYAIIEGELYQKVNGEIVIAEI